MDVTNGIQQTKLPAIPQQALQITAATGPCKGGLKPPTNMHIGPEKFRYYKSNGLPRGRQQSVPEESNNTKDYVGPRFLSKSRRHNQPKYCKVAQSSPKQIMTFGNYKLYMKEVVDPVLRNLTTAMFLHKPTDPLDFICKHFEVLVESRDKSEKPNNALDSLIPDYNGTDQIPIGTSRKFTFQELYEKSCVLKKNNSKLADKIAEKNPEFGQQQLVKAEKERIQDLELYADGREGEWVQSYHDYKTFLSEVVRPLLLDASMSLFEQKPATPIQFLLEHMRSVQKECPYPSMLQPFGRGTENGKAFTISRMIEKISRQESRRLSLRMRQRRDNIARVRNEAIKSSCSPVLSAQEGIVKIQSHYRGRKGRENALQKSREVAYNREIDDGGKRASKIHAHKMREVRRREGKLTDEDILWDKEQLESQLLEIVKEREENEKRNEARKLKQVKNQWKSALSQVIHIQALARGKVVRMLM